MLRKFNFSTKSILTLSLITLSLLSFLFYNRFKNNFTDPPPQINTNIEFNLISKLIRENFLNGHRISERLNKGNTILILYTDVPGLGCRECLGLEICDWRDFSKNYSPTDSVSILCIVSRCRNEARLLQEINAMKANPLIFFSESFQVKAWTPYIFMLRDGQVINSYLGDMNDRSKTEKYMREFATHLSNPIPVD